MNTFKNEMKRKWKIWGLILLVIIAISLVFGWRLQIPRAPGYNGAVITLRRNACMIDFPDYLLTIYGDGKIIYQGYSSVSVTGIQTGQIPEEEVRNLINEMTKKGYFFYFAGYISGITDQPTVTTSLSINGIRKSF
ncbi:MAG: DUF6438 domain-containing protein, partial [bacterium]|nr:DUF6438 domain-containing protein [bacterium]